MEKSDDADDDAMYNCSYVNCKECFSRKELLDDHMERKHFCCKNCGRFLKDYDAYLEHMERRHFRCSHCWLYLRGFAALNKHQSSYRCRTQLPTV